DLLKVETEGDQVAARNAAARKGWVTAANGLERDEVQPHALQAQFEVHIVSGVQLAARGAAQLVDSLVLKCGHEREVSRQRQVRRYRLELVEALRQVHGPGHLCDARAGIQDARDALLNERPKTFFDGQCSYLLGGCA